MSSTQLDHPTSRMSWADSLPPGWSVQRLRNLAYLSNSNVDKKSYEDGHGVRLCNYTDVYYNEFITDDMEFMSATATPAEIRRFALQPGDVIITKDSESWNDIAVPACVGEELNNVVCGYHLTLIRPIPAKIDGRFLLRAFQAQGVREQFWLASNGVTRFGLGQQGMKDALIPVPPIGTQRAIADFLDRKTAAIDALIQKKEKLIELLEEKRAALINQAVTKGLDPNAPMKDSGIPWIGEIPAHWEVTRLSFRYHQQLGKMLNQEAALGLEQRPYLGNKDVQWDEVNVSDLKTMHFSASERIKFELKSGDLLVCEGGMVGRTAIWRGELKECYFQKAIHRLRPRDPNRENARFFFYCIRGAEERGLFDEHGEKATIGHLTGEALRAHRFPFPPRMEQRAIADCLDNSIGAMNRAKSVVTRQIQLLKEFRQSLITMAVVGRLAMPSIQELSPVKVVESQEHS